MKKKMKIIKTNVFWTIGMIGVVLLASACDSPKGREIHKKIQTIELGMTKEDVLEILGKPLSQGEHEWDGVQYVVMTFKALSADASTIPSITICKETGVVVKVIVDDSGRYDKISRSPNPCTISAEADSMRRHLTR